jgi:hypothetical protein
VGANKLVPVRHFAMLVNFTSFQQGHQRFGDAILKKPM